MGTAPRWGAAILISVLLVACHAEDDAFFSKIFLCRPGAAQDPCGTTMEGRPMICFEGETLGGEDFCAEACDPVQGSRDPTRFTCVSSGALLPRCRPTASHTDPTAACPDGLQCYRTDLLSDDGVCMALHVCSDDNDCHEAVSGTTCSGTLLRDRVSGPIFSDNLQCVQSMCKSSLGSCPRGQSCLASFYNVASDVPDICVPNCDGQKHCPPNFSCAQSPSASGAPSICVPGLPGIRCTARDDCILGDCVDTGAGFSVCTFPCRTNADCESLSGRSNSVVCAEGIPGAGHHCISSTPFQGANCASDDDCLAGQRCFRYSPYGTISSHGECRVPCDDQGGCPARGGLPHLCLAEGLGGCYPGNFGLPCQSSAECLGDLVCDAVSPDGRYPQGARICTTTCLVDADCDADPWTTKGGYCQDGLCHMGQATGAPCVRDGECFTRSCAGAAGMQGLCIDGTGP